MWCLVLPNSYTTWHSKKMIVQIWHSGGYAGISYTPPAGHLKQSITLNFHFIIKIKCKVEGQKLCWFCIQLLNVSWETWACFLDHIFLTYMLEMAMHNSWPKLFKGDLLNSWCSPLKRNFVHTDASQKCWTLFTTIQKCTTVEIIFKESIVHWHIERWHTLNPVKRFQ